MRSSTDILDHFNQNLGIRILIFGFSECSIVYIRCISTYEASTSASVRDKYCIFFHDIITTNKIDNKEKLTQTSIRTKQQLRNKRNKMISKCTFLFFGRVHVRHRTDSGAGSDYPRSPFITTPVGPARVGSTPL